MQKGITQGDTHQTIKEPFMWADTFKPAQFTLGSFFTKKHVLSLCVFFSQSVHYLPQFKPNFVTLLLLELIFLRIGAVVLTEGGTWSHRGRRLDHLLYFWLAGLIPVYHVALTAMIALTQLFLSVCFQYCSCPIIMDCRRTTVCVSFLFLGLVSL